MNNKKVVILSISFFFLFGCRKQLGMDEYEKFISDPENGLRKDEIIGDFQLSVMYEPTDYLLGKSGESEKLKEVREGIEQFEHFQFRIKLVNGGNILLYKETQFQNEVTRINHFGFEAKEDFVVVSGNDTSECKLAHYSRNYNLAPTIDLSLAFDNIEINNDWQFIYQDSQFNLGKVKFLFKQEDLENTPEIKL